jgi:hypothetical protein
MDRNRSGEAGQQANDAASWRHAYAPGKSEWRPAAGFGRLVGSGLIAFFATAGIAAALLLIRSDGAMQILWLLMLLSAAAGVGGVAYVLKGLASLRYVLTDDHLRIEWMRETRRVPYDDMLEVIYHLRERLELPGRERYWPGFYVSVVQTRGGVWRSYATVPPHRRIRITTPSAVIAISPERPVLFIQELERRRLGRTEDTLDGPHSEIAVVAPTRSISQPPTAARQERALPFQRSIDMLRQDLLHDRIASTLVAIGIIIPVFMLAYTFNEVDFLPDGLPLHWDANGEVDRTGDAASIWTLPLLALTVLVVNTGLATLVLPFDRVLARLLVSFTPVVQIAIGIALLRIVN